MTLKLGFSASCSTSCARLCELGVMVWSALDTFPLPLSGSFPITSVVRPPSLFPPLSPFLWRIKWESCGISWCGRKGNGLSGNPNSVSIFFTNCVIPTNHQASLGSDFSLIKREMKLDEHINVICDLYMTIYVTIPLVILITSTLYGAKHKHFCLSFF